MRPPERPAMNPRNAGAYAAGEDSLIPGCVLPGCGHLVDEPGEVCPACLALWGPYLKRDGDPSPWQPTKRPACGHSWWWFRDGRCDTCGGRDLVDVE